MKMFRYDDNLTILMIDLLSYIVGINILLNIYHIILSLKWAILNNLLPYKEGIEDFIYEEHYKKLFVLSLRHYI